MIRLLSGSEKWLEIFKCKNNLSRSEYFCTAEDAERSESTSHHCCCSGRFGFARGGWVLLTPCTTEAVSGLIFPPRSPLTAVEGALPWKANRVVVVRVPKYRLSQLRTEEVISRVISILELSAFCSQHQDKRVWHQPPNIFPRCL